MIWTEENIGELRKGDILKVPHNEPIQIVGIEQRGDFMVFIVQRDSEYSMTFIDKTFVTYLNGIKAERND